MDELFRKPGSLTSGISRGLKLVLVIICALSFTFGWILGVGLSKSDENHNPRGNGNKIEKLIPYEITSENSIPHEVTSKKPRIFDNPSLQQNDSAVVSYIREFYLTPPSQRPYSLKDAKDPEHNPSQYANEIMSLFRNKLGGFFIEAGANNGEFLSNTLQLERKYHWSGLLIEPSIFMLSQLRLKFRKAWIAGLCLSLTGYPQKVRFMHRLVQPSELEPWTDGMGIIHQWYGVSPPAQQRNQDAYIYAGPAECFPLYSVLLAVNQTVVDYFSFDIEGMELKVLKAIPFELVTIKVFSIEHQHIPEGEQALREFLESKGYVIVLKRDFELFAVHKDYLQEFNISNTS